MNFEILIFHLKKGLTEYYTYRMQYSDKTTTVLTLLGSIRPFIEHYQKTRNDYTGEKISLNYPELTQVYTYSSQVLHAYGNIPTKFTPKKLKQDLKTLAKLSLGKTTYKNIKDQCKYESEY